MIENHTKTLEFEFIISIITYFVINYIIAFTLKEMNQLRSEKHYYYEQVQKKNNELEKIAVTDYLTTLNNYQSFHNYFNKVKTKSVKYKDQMCLTLIDIDNFKIINDTYGHVAGDQVLREISRILKTSIRETDFVARYGGEEFAIVFPNTELKDKSNKTLNGMSSILKASKEQEISMGTNSEKYKEIGMIVLETKLAVDGTKDLTEKIDLQKNEIRKVLTEMIEIAESNSKSTEESVANTEEQTATMNQLANTANQLLDLVKASEKQINVFQI